MTIKKYAGDKITGLAADTRPTNVPEGATFYELDTGKVYRRYSSAWTEIDNTKANNAYNLANTANSLASNALPNTSGVSFDGNLTVTSNLKANVINSLSGFIDLGPGSRPAYAEGRIYYDSVDKSLTVHNDTSFTFPIGQIEYARVWNESGNTLPKGAPVYATGYHMTNHHHFTVELADASDPAKYDVVGLVAADIPDASHGYIIVRGWIGGINTASLTAGSRFHLGYSAPGTLVTTAPEYPNYPFDIGFCTVSDPTNGYLYVDRQTHTLEGIRVTGAGRIGGDFVVEGDFTVLGQENTITVNSLQVGTQFIYLGSGDSISNANTTFTGTGLDDLEFRGKYTGTGTTNYYVTISDVNPDKFSWSYLSNFSVLEQQNVVIQFQTTQALSNGISVYFNSNTGHTIGDKWNAAAVGVSADFGVVGNHVDGPNGYTHSGLFRDATDGTFKFFRSYDPEVLGNINTGDTTYALANVQVLRITGTEVYEGATRLSDSISVASDIGSSAFDKANSANIIASQAFDKANSTTYTSNVVISVADNTNAALRITQTGTGNAIRVEDSANPDASPFVITSEGKVGLGIATPTEIFEVVPSLSLSDSYFYISDYSTGTGRAAYFGTVSYNNDAIGDGVALYYSRGTRSSRQAVQQNDEISYISFYGWDGTSFLGRAWITAEVDNTVSTGTIPMAIAFNTGSNAAPERRMQISSSGNVLIGRTDSTVGQNVKLDVNGAINASAVLVNGAPLERTTFTSNVVISVNDNTNAALRITQTGTGEAIRVEDSSNPDASPFVVTATGNVGIGTANPVVPLQANGMLLVTLNGASPLSAVGEIAELIHNANSYVQVHVRNANTGTIASSDVVVTTDTGTDTDEYIDLGVNNSNYNDPSWTINGAKDGYLIMKGGNLAIGTANTVTMKTVDIFTMGTLATDLVMSVANGVSIGYPKSDPGANNLFVRSHITANSMNLVPTIQASFDKANSALANGSVTLAGQLTTTQPIKVLAVGGDEGGEIQLANAVTNSVVNGSVIIDIFQNRIRFFESGGTSRGAFINLATSAAGVGTNLQAGENTAINYVIDGGGSAITAGQKGHLEIPFNCTLHTWTILLDQTGSISIEVWADTYANFPPTSADSINASPYVVTSATKAQGTVNPANANITAGEILAFNVVSASTTTRATISLKAVKT